jgi:hypothetical protein
METFYDFITRHYRMKEQDNLRLGQRFVIEFVKPDTTVENELFFIQDDMQAMGAIQAHLEMLHYFPHMPPKS